MRNDNTVSSPRRALLPSGNSRDFDGWLKKFDNHCSKHYHISSALKRLVANGTPKQILIPWLYSASDLHRRPVKDRRQVGGFANPSKRIERTAALLETGAQELLNLTSNLMFLALIAGHPPKATPDDVARAMTSCAQSLRDLPCNPLSSSFSYRGVWKNLPTIVCVGLVKRRNAKSPYKDLAHLMEAAYAGHGVNKIVLPDNLRSEYDHFFRTKVGRGLLFVESDFVALAEYMAKAFQIPA